MALLETLKTLGEVIGSIILVIGTFWRTFGKKWYTSYREKIQKEKEALNAQIKLIKDKLYPNGGSSIDDKVEKIMEKMANVQLGLNSLQVGHRNTWDILDIASWESDSEGRITYVSSAYCSLVGCTPGEVSGNSWIGRVASFDRDSVVKLWKQAIENASEFNFTFSIEKDDGLYQKVTPIVIHNKDKEGKVLNSLGRLIKIGEPYKI